jgi:type I restriction enzyme S subunit
MNGLVKYSFNEVLDVRDGTHDSPKYVDDGFPLITSKNLVNGKIDFNNINYITENDFIAINKRSKVDIGDILYSMIGSIGNFAVVSSEVNFAIKNVALFKFKNGKITNKYLVYFIQSNEFLKQIESQSKGGTQKFVTLKILRNIQIPLPPLPQQQKIANILDAADALRQKDKALLAKYDELTQALFLDMFGDPVNNPKGWERVVFGNFITVLTDYHSNGSYETLRDHVTLKNEPDYALMVRTTDLENNNFEDGVNYIDENAYNHLDKSKVYGGEIIMNKIGSAGKVYRMPYLNRPVSLGMNAFLLRFNDSINDVFLYFLLISKYGEREIQKRVKGAVTKTIRKDAVREIPLITPPISLQNQFAERVHVIEQQKAIAQQSLEKSEALFNSLLQKAFKGELV